jgi:hypothetical protein
MCLAEDAQNPLDEVYNEEAINRVLAESNPDVGYLVRLTMMKAHLKASLSTMKNGLIAEGAEHVSHPRKEIYPDLEPDLKRHDAQGLNERLQLAEVSIKSGDTIKATQDINFAIEFIETAEQAVTSRKGTEHLVIDVISALLRTSVVEYHQAFEYSKLSNMVEYHDGAFFVAEAKVLLEGIAPSLESKDSKALTKLQDSFGKLAAAWPQEAPPQKSVLPVTRMQALVSVIDLQLNKLR